MTKIRFSKFYAILHDFSESIELAQAQSLSYTSYLNNQSPESQPCHDYLQFLTVTMSVVGVDLGTLNTVIAVARNRGVDVVSKSLHVKLPKLFVLM